eukprot:40231-Chlamydomonas_euryale.AAC.2
MVYVHPHSPHPARIPHAAQELDVDGDGLLTQRDLDRYMARLLAERTQSAEGEARFAGATGESSARFVRGSASLSMPASRFGSEVRGDALCGGG